MPTEAPQIRLARPAEAPVIAALSRDLIEAGLSWSWRPQRVLRDIRDPATNVLVAEADGRIAGFAVMWFGVEEARLNLLAVRPEIRRRGLGRRLVQWLEKAAVVAGISVVYLEVRARNLPAQRFYQGLGYHRVGEIAGYYQGRESAVRMGRDLWAAAATGPGPLVPWRPPSPLDQ